MADAKANLTEQGEGQVRNAPKKQSPQDQRVHAGDGRKPALNSSNSDLPAGVPKRKIEPESIIVNVFGDLLKFSKKVPQSQTPFRKYDFFAMSLVDVEKEQRYMLYAFLLGLGLTAHARRIKDSAQRKEVFNLKNELFLTTANNFSMRRMLNFRHCQSKRFKVTKYCDSCLAANKAANLLPRMWKYCQNCTVDRDYYNVLSMFHKFPEGGASLFLGNDLLAEVKGLKVLKKIPFGHLEEEIKYKKYAFSPKTLVCLELTSLIKAAKQVLEQMQKLRELSTRPVLGADARIPGAPAFGTRQPTMTPASEENLLEKRAKSYALQGAGAAKVGSAGIIRPKIVKKD